MNVQTISNRRNEAGIEAHSDVQGQEEYLILSSGASVVFTEGRLHSIHFKRKDKKAQRKQMTVSLPEEAVEKLQHRAQEEGLSVQALIERMIQAGA
jgi:ribosomal protein S3AE